MPSPTRITLNDQVVSTARLITAMETIINELKERRDTLLTEESLIVLITKALNANQELFAGLCGKIATSIGHRSIIHGVAAETKKTIEEHLDIFIAQQLSAEYLEARMVKIMKYISEGGSVESLVQPISQHQEPSEIPLDSPENISLVLKLLANSDAVE